MVLEKTLESLVLQTNKPVNLKENQPQIFVGRTDAEAEALILWPPDVKSQLTENKTKQNKTNNNLLLGKIEGKRRRGQRMRLLDSIIDSMDMNLSKLQEIIKDREAWCTAVHGVMKLDTT